MILQANVVQKGSLLVAELALTGDLSFSRSLIYMTEHNNETGSVGFIINKSTDLMINDLLPEVEGDFKIYKGGPVDEDNLYYLHKLPEILTDSIEIADGIYWGGNFNLLMQELKKGTIPSDKIKFFLGYSGWAPEQLDEEIRADSWIILDNKVDVFMENDASKWKDKLLELGGEYVIWANSPENPNYN